jgi:hypothetical protein
MSYDGDDPRAPYEKRNVEYAKDARDKLKALHNNRINKFSKKS